MLFAGGVSVDLTDGSLNSLEHKRVSLPTHYVGDGSGAAPEILTVRPGHGVQFVRGLPRLIVQYHLCVGEIMSGFLRL